LRIFYPDETLLTATWKRQMAASGLRSCAAHNYWLQFTVILIAQYGWFHAASCDGAPQ
jgi:hypothetical protein